MKIGRVNVVFGWIWLLFGILTGIYLQNKIGSGQEWMTSSKRMFLKSFHLHGSVFAIISILYGYGLYHIKLGNTVKVIGSILMIVGTILFSGALFLASFKYSLIKLTYPGTWCIVLSIVILIIGLFKPCECKKD